VVAHDTLLRGTNPQQRLLRAFVAPICLELNPHTAEHLKRVREQQKLRLGINR